MNNCDTAYFDNFYNHIDRITVHKKGVDESQYDIVYSTTLDTLAEILRFPKYAGRRACIITDSVVGPLYADKIAACVTPAPMIYILPAGEEHKNLDEIRGILRFLIENHFDRSSYLIALGGGVIGDMTGFVASIFLRGIDFVQIPTTLLAQADSSIGGKTGVDFDGFKNMVGAFKMPGLVYANVDFLRSLDDVQFASGFVEIMKHGLIKDEKYYYWLIAHKEAIENRDIDILHQMLVRSNEIKRDVVEADPYEHGERMLLNYGHTIGHAIEKYKNFTMTHGACVALGCIASAYIACQRGDLTQNVYEEIRDQFVPFHLSAEITDIDAQEVLRLTKSDKKMAKGHIRFILLHRIGDAYVDETVTDEEILDAIRAITREDHE